MNRSPSFSMGKSRWLDSLPLLLLFPLGLAATVGGLYAVVWSSGWQCAGLTMRHLWEVVPVWGYVIGFIASVFGIELLLQKRAQVDAISPFSIAGFAFWVALGNGFFLMPLGYAIFPSEKVLLAGVECAHRTEDFFTLAVGPFMVGQFLGWALGLGLLTWIHGRLNR